MLRNSSDSTDMQVLKIGELIALPIFRCKICSGRLQSPVLKVGNFGNICMSCYTKSAYVDTTENAEIETILSKFDVPCNFAEAGCRYTGPFYKTCDHEKKCRFRKRLCPFSHFSQCEFEFIKKMDAIDHICQKHEKSVLKAENGCVSLENPTACDPDAIYLLEIGKVPILLRIKLKPEKELIYYVFYHFGDFQGTRINISSTAFEKCKKNCRILHESEITPKFDKSNAFQAKVLTLKHLGYFKKIKILVSLNVNVTGNDCVEEPAKIDLWSRCLKCNKYVNSMWLCASCHYRACETCCRCTNKHTIYLCNDQNCNGSLYYINFANAGITQRIPCENNGCKQISEGSVQARELHYNYQCSFKMQECFAGNCKFEGFTYELIKHIIEKHQCENTKQFPLQYDMSYIHLFTNGYDIFLHKFLLTKEKQLELECVKITEPFWDDSYIWTVDIIHQSRRPITIRGDYTLKGCTRKLAVGEFIDEDRLLLEIHVKCI